jgi:hypothetical protein
MNVYRELNRLRVSIEKLTVLVLLTLVIQIGIIVILTLPRKVKLTSERSLSQYPSGYGQLDINLRETHLWNCENFENTLLNILEIRAPIGMFPVRPSVVPLPVPVSSRSFGADQCASSEGFLVTFTPERGVVIFCDYSCFSEYFIQIHSFEWKTVYPRSRPSLPSSANQRLEKRVPVCAKNGSTAKHSYDTSEVQGRRMRHNLMMTTTSLGILVASEPTDEGRIGTGRNTERYDERS